MYSALIKIFELYLIFVALLLLEISIINYITIMIRYLNSLKI